MKKICIGIDIAKETFDATVLLVEDLDVFKHVGYCKFENRPSGFRSLVSWARKQCKQCKGRIDEDCVFCMETTGGYDRSICLYLHDKGLIVWRESAIQIRRSSGFRRGKDDKADSRNIAEYAAKNQSRLVEFSPDSEAVAELKEMVNYRSTLVERRKEAKTRLSEKLATSGSKGKALGIHMIIKLSKKEIRCLDKMIEECDDEIKCIVEADDDMKRNFQHITSVKGVGAVNAACLIAYSGNFLKIPTPNKMSCYMGAVTFYEDSGTSVHKRDPNKNVCCKMIKNNLRMAAKCAMDYNMEIKEYAERLEKKGKPYGIIINNVINKLVHIIYSLVKNNCDYEYNHELLRTIKGKEATA